MFTAWRSLRRFNRLERSEREIVFYAESRADWPHIGPILSELTQRAGPSVCYVTSDQSDPLLSDGDPRVRSFYVGSGMTRTTFFRLLDASVLVMTLPDLETFHLKRSVHDVHYVYVFHSMVSTHMIYRKGAFDAYDTILCVGPHHVAEIRRTQEVYGLPEKRLVPHGYARLDAILDSHTRQGPRTPSAGPERDIVLAPSWGECSYIEAPVGRELVSLLLEAGHRLVVRLHPMTVRRFPKLASELERQFGGRPLRVETDMREKVSLHDSDLMIADWSGAALEYAFGLERPVLFIDTPKKVNNPEYQRIGLPAIEESIRADIGAIAQPSDMRSVLPLVDELCADPDAFRERLRAAREAAVYNVGRSASVGAAEVARLANRQRTAAQAQTDG